MTEPINIRIDASQMLQGLGNLTGQVDQFNLALGRVDQASKRIFASLEQLSQRYQQQGFLGQGDQRTMEQSLRQWERASQILELNRRGAEGRLQAAQARSLGTRGDIARIGQAAAVASHYERAQWGMGVLEGAVGNLLGGPVPASPLQAAQMAAARLPTPWAAGRYSVWPGGPTTLAAGLPPARAISQAQLNQQVASAMGFGPGGGQPYGGLTPAQLAAQAGGAIGLATPPAVPFPMPSPTGPTSPWPGTFGQRMMGYAGMYAGQIPGMLGQAAGGAYGMLHGPARGAMQIAGAVSGVGVYGTLTEAMDLYRQRARGVIDTGMQLDLNFKRVGGTIDFLRDRYRILAHDSIAAMQAMGRVTGRYDPAAVDQAVGFGVAYGITPGAAGHLAGTMAMRGTGTFPMDRAFAAARASYGRGGLPMAGGPLAEEITAIAGYGGAAAVPMDTGHYGAWAGFIGGLGQRYREPGQTAAAYGRLASGLATAPDPTTQALRIRAIQGVLQRRMARGLGSEMTFGQGEGAVTVDLRNITGQRVAMENAMQSDEIMQGYWQFAQQQAGTNPDQAQMFFEHFMTPGLTTTESLRMRQGWGKTGGPAGALRRGDLAAETNITATRDIARVTAEEFAPQLVQATLEPLLERLGKPLVQASDELKKALGGLAQSMQDGTFSMDALKQAVQSLQGGLMIAGTLTALGANSSAGVGLGLGMLGVGVASWGGLFGTPPAQPGWDLPVLGDPFATVPARPGPALVPQQSTR